MHMEFMHNKSSASNSPNSPERFCKFSKCLIENLKSIMSPQLKSMNKSPRTQNLWQLHCWPGLYTDTKEMNYSAFERSGIGL